MERRTPAASPWEAGWLGFVWAAAGVISTHGELAVRVSCEGHTVFISGAGERLGLVCTGLCSWFAWYGVPIQI